MFLILTTYIHLFRLRKLFWEKIIKPMIEILISCRIKRIIKKIKEEKWTNIGVQCADMFTIPKWEIPLISNQELHLRLCLMIGFALNAAWEKKCLKKCRKSFGRFNIKKRLVR